MAMGLSYFFLLLSLHSICFSGTSEGITYNARETRSPKETSSMAASIQRKQDLAKEMIFPTFRRKLRGRKLVTIHDNIPLTNPTTVLPTPSPFTFPNPMTSPVTVPATNPLPTPITNPTTTPVTNPTTTPVTNPTTSPVTNPIAPPVTVPPAVPVTNPVNQPVTNPVTTYPFPPPSSTVPVGGMPSTVPVGGTPTAGMGQTWCVAKSGVTETALQMALDYACGIGGADCSTIQMSGSCYNPNSLEAHASYAFNSYYQKNPVPTSCDFGGVAMIVTANPSTGTCVFPSSSSASSVNPTPITGPNPATNPGSGTNPASNTGGGFGPISTTPTYGVTPTYGSSSGTGPSVMNGNNSAGPSSVLPDSPMGTISSSAVSLCVGWTLLVLTSTASCFSGLN